MLFCTIKSFIFSIILGTLTLIYNKDRNGLYKNLKYDNIVLGSINYRSLAELSHDHRTNQKHKNNQLREYQKTKEEQYKKNKYPNDDAKTKQKIPQGTENKNTGTPNKMSSKKKTYGNEKEEKSNISARRLRYLEMQRKLYNDCEVKEDWELQNDSDDEYKYGWKKCLNIFFIILLIITGHCHYFCMSWKNKKNKGK
ncbi:stevor PIR protein, putative [Plasmodium sp. gorilla clade G2]|uniref:stevor PIR protein, putative n=1 Tax=Plasmodium sp. gorilla clade G2 TaxID=880535 RepID=UPI000D2BC960|nr:stevor PIR protein, putative [Plasmodium sp. gorilla clade G2]SOV20441.1 stevor PIR protein, putative [Plasmodium sp. gorilla clade G2]